jgi:hypothetical protein
MKVYVILVDYRNGRDTKVYGVYKQYRQAYLEERRLREISETLWGGDQIKVRIVDQEVTE